MTSWKILCSDPPKLRKRSCLNFFLMFTNISHITKWILLIFRNIYFFQHPLDDWFENFLKEVRNTHKKGKKHIRKFLWPIKNFQKYFMTHQYLLKIFHAPCRNPPPPNPSLPSPSYIFNVRFYFFSFKNHALTSHFNITHWENSVIQHNSLNSVKEWLLGYFWLFSYIYTIN